MDGHADTNPLDHVGAASPPPPPPPPLSPAPDPGRRPVLRGRAATAAVAGGLMLGGVAGGYVVSQAASSSPSAAVSPPPGTGTGGAGSATTVEPPCRPGHGLRAEDRAVVATAIGLSTAQLQKELTPGTTIAAVARAHGVDAAKVIAALAASENDEIDQRVAAGRITPAQGTQLKSLTTQRATNQVNSTPPPDDGPSAG